MGSGVDPLFFLVERCVACQSRKSDFRWHRFRFSPCLMHKRVQKSQAILALLDSFQGLHLECWAWVIIVFDVFFMQSSTVYAASLCTFVRFKTMIWPSIRFDISFQKCKKPLDIYFFTAKPLIKSHDQEPLIVIEGDCYFLGVHIRLPTQCKMFHSKIT